MSKADHSSNPPQKGQPDGIQTQRIPRVYPASLFCMLTGLLLLLTFSFLPWFAISSICNKPCNINDLGVEVYPGVSPGLTLAGDVITFFSGSSLIPPTTGSLPLDQFRPPLLWILPVMSSLLLLLPLVLRFKSRKLAPIRIGVIVLVFCISLLTELFYLVNAFSVFADLSTITLSTIPIIGFWLALLLTIVGGTLTIWATFEKRSLQSTITRRLGHLDYTAAKGRYRSYVYRTAPFDVTRPERGAINTVHPCPFCGKKLTLHTASYQRLWLYRSLIALCLIASTFLIIFSFQQSALYIAEGLDAGGYAYLIALSLCLTIFFLCLLFLVDKVNLAQSILARDHRIFWPEKIPKTTFSFS